MFDEWIVTEALESHAFIWSNLPRKYKTCKSNRICIDIHGSSADALLKGSTKTVGRLEHKMAMMLRRVRSAERATEDRSREAARVSSQRASCAVQGRGEGVVGEGTVQAGD